MLQGRCRRFNGQVDFNRSHADYKEGFGSLNGEHWLGLERMHHLTYTSGDNLVCRVDLYGCEGEHATAEYEVFQVGA